MLASAPALIGDIQDIRERFDSYRAELAKIVTNVSKLYDVASSLPSAPPSDAISVLWVSDIHDNPEAFDVMESLISQFGVKAVVDTGDYIGPRHGGRERAVRVGQSGARALHLRSWQP